jgi:DNA-binding IclR family transcriptional regulator
VPWQVTHRYRSGEPAPETVRSEHGSLPENVPLQTMNDRPARATRETTLRRGLDILNLLASEPIVRRGGIGVLDLARTVDMDPSQASRTLQVLREYELVDRDATTGLFRLGWRFFSLAAAAGDDRLRRAADEVLARLMTRSGEAAYLSVLSGSKVLTVAGQRPPTVIQAVNWVGQYTPLECTSAGRALLWDFDDEQVRGLVSAPPAGARAKAPSTVEELLVRLKDDRSVGASVSQEELEPGLVGIAAPVRDFRDAVVASINIDGPLFRVGKRLDELVVMVREAARELSTALGWSEPEIVAPGLDGEDAVVRLDGAGPSAQAGTGGRGSPRRGRRDEPGV